MDEHVAKISNITLQKILAFIKKYRTLPTDLNRQNETSRKDGYMSSASAMAPHPPLLTAPPGPPPYADPVMPPVAAYIPRDFTPAPAARVATIMEGTDLSDDSDDEFHDAEAPTRPLSERLSMTKASHRLNRTSRLALETASAMLARAEEMRERGYDTALVADRSPISAMSDMQYEGLRAAIMDANKAAISYIDARMETYDEVAKLQREIASLKAKSLESEFKTQEMREFFSQQYTLLINSNNTLIQTLVRVETNLSTTNITSVLDEILRNIRDDLTKVHNQLLVTNLTPIASQNERILSILNDREEPTINNYITNNNTYPAIEEPARDVDGNRNYALVPAIDSNTSQAILLALNSLQTVFKDVLSIEAAETRRAIAGLNQGENMERALALMERSMASMAALDVSSLSTINENFNGLRLALKDATDTTGQRIELYQTNMATAINNFQQNINQTVNQNTLMITGTTNTSADRLARIMEAAQENTALRDYLQTYLEQNGSTQALAIEGFKSFITDTFQNIDEINRDDVRTIGLNIEGLRGYFEQVASRPAPAALPAPPPVLALTDGSEAAMPPAAAAEVPAVNNPEPEGRVKEEAQINALALVNEELAKKYVEAEELKRQAEEVAALMKEREENQSAANRALRERLEEQGTNMATLQDELTKTEGRYAQLLSERDSLIDQINNLDDENQKLREIDISEETPVKREEVGPIVFEGERPPSPGPLPEIIQPMLPNVDPIDEVLGEMPLSKVEIKENLNYFQDVFNGQLDPAPEKLADRFRQGASLDDEHPDYTVFARRVDEELEFRASQLAGDNDISTPTSYDNTLADYVRQCVKRGAFITSAAEYPPDLRQMIAQHNSILTDTFFRRSRAMAAELNMMHNVYIDKTVDEASRRKSFVAAAYNLNQYYSDVETAMSGIMKNATDENEITEFWNHIGIGMSGELDRFFQSGSHTHNESLRQLQSLMLKKHSDMEGLAVHIRNERLAQQTGVANQNGPVEYITAPDADAPIGETDIKPRFVPRGLDTVGLNLYVNPITHEIQAFKPLVNLDINTPAQGNQDQGVGVLGSGTNMDELQLYYKQILQECEKILSNSERSLTIPEINELGSKLNEMEQLSKQLKGVDDSRFYADAAFMLDGAKKVINDKRVKREEDEDAQQTVYPGEDQANQMQPLPLPIKGPQTGPTSDWQIAPKDYLFDIKDLLIEGVKVEDYKPFSDEEMKQLEYNLFKKVAAENQLTPLLIGIQPNSATDDMEENFDFVNKQYELNQAEFVVNDAEIKYEKEEADNAAMTEGGAEGGDEGEFANYDDKDPTEMPDVEIIDEIPGMPHKGNFGPDRKDDVTDYKRQKSMDRVAEAYKKKLSSITKIPKKTADMRELTRERFLETLGFDKKMKVKMEAMRELMDVLEQVRKEKRLKAEPTDGDFVGELDRTLESEDKTPVMEASGVRLKCSHCKGSDERVGKGFHCSKDGEVMHRGCFEGKGMTSKRKLFKDAVGEDINEKSTNKKLRRMYESHKRATFHDSMKTINKPLAYDDFQKSIPAHVRARIAKRVNKASSQYVGRGVVDESYIQAYTNLLGNKMTHEKSDTNWASINRQIMRAKILHKYKPRRRGRGITTRDNFDPTNFNSLHTYIRRNPHALYDFDE